MEHTKLGSVVHALPQLFSGEASLGKPLGLALPRADREDNFSRRGVTLQLLYIKYPYMNLYNDVKF